jgi:hypothetical protein
VATLPAAVANALALGSHTIAVAYTSSSLGFANSNADRVFTVTPAPSVAVAPASTALSVAAGGSVTDTITATPINGYTGTLQFSCSGLPEYSTCSFQPSSVTLGASGSPQSTVVTIQTMGSNTQFRGMLFPLPAGTPLFLPAAVLWAPGILAAAFGSRKRKLWLPLFCFALLALTACGGGGSPSQSSPPAPSTPTGSSTVQITASNGGKAVESFSLTLTVQ